MDEFLDAAKRIVGTALVVITTGFALYTGHTGPFEPSIQRSFFVAAVLPLAFLRIPSGFLRNPTTETAFGFLLAGLSVAVLGYTMVEFKRVFFDAFLTDLDIAVALVGIVLILEAVRRTVGPSITVILVLFIVYGLLGTNVPVDALIHGGLSLEMVAGQVFYGTDGVFGPPIGVAATFIIIILMLGTMLTQTGGAEMFMNLAKAIAGRYTGGPAKIAVVSSALFGTITGATVANVAATGSVTIPMMKRAGYQPRFAGAVEALASSGGQIMPPIMGAAAFLIIDFLNIGYGELLISATIPAALYFFSVFMVVHMRSVKVGLTAIPRAEIPSAWDELKKRGHMLLPIILLVALLANRFGTMYAAYLAVVAAIVLAPLRRETRIDWRGYYRAAESAVDAMLPLVAICAGAGIMIGVMTATGVNLKITHLIELVGQGNLFVTLVMTMIACLVLGMGLPTVAAYLVLAALVPAALVNLGILPIAAHLFIFYFAILSAITPPVCTGAYVAAGIAGSNPMHTGFTAMRLGWIAYLLPFAFVYDPALLAIGSPGDIALHIVACAAGIVFWAFGLEGYVNRPISWSTRGLFLGGGAMMIWPDMIVSGTGLAICSLTLLAVLLLPRPQPQPQPQPPASAASE